MERTRLGASGLHVSRACFGTMTFANPADEDTSWTLLDRAREAGVDFFDSANMYSAGQAEEILGRWLQARGNRDELVITSKVRYPVGDAPHTSGLTPKVIVRELEQTLRRLGTDYLDIYYLHQPDDDTPIEVTWRCLQDLVTAGKVRTLGLSNYAAWQVTEAALLARNQGWSQPLVMQPMYNLLSRSVEAEFFPMTRRFDLANCVYNPLAGGLLTGKYRGTSDPRAVDGRLAQNEYYRKRYWHPELLEASGKLEEIARENGRTPVGLALRFVLDQPDVTSVLLGATEPGQLRECLDAFSSPPLSEEEQAACDRVWEKLKGPVPRYHRNNADAKIH